MTQGARLELLRSDLQLLTASNDPLLMHFLNAAENAINIEGIRDDESVEYDAIIISYAAYLFRKRSQSTAGGKDSETAMPRFLRWQMNNLLLHQKAGGTDDI